MDKEKPETTLNLPIFEDILDELKRISLGINQRGGAAGSTVTNNKGSVVEELKKIFSNKQDSNKQDYNKSPENKASLVKDFSSFGIKDIFKAKFNELLTNALFPAKPKEPQLVQNSQTSQSNLIEPTKLEEENSKQQEPVLVKVVSAEADGSTPKAAPSTLTDENTNSRSVLEKDNTINVKVTNFNELGEMFPSLIKKGLLASKLSDTLDSLAKNVSEMQGGGGGLLKTLLGAGAAGGGFLGLRGLFKKFFGKEVVPEVAEAGGKKLLQEGTEAGGKKLLEEGTEAGGKKLLQEGTEATGKKGFRGFLQKGLSKAKPVVDLLKKTSFGKKAIAVGTIGGLGYAGLNSETAQPYVEQVKNNFKDEFELNKRDKDVRNEFESTDQTQVKPPVIENATDQTQVKPPVIENENKLIPTAEVPLTDLKKIEARKEKAAETDMTAATTAGVGAGILGYQGIKKAGQQGVEKGLEKVAVKGATKLGAKAASSAVPLLGSAVAAGFAYNDYQEASKIEDPRLRLREQARAIGSGTGGVLGGSLGMGAGIVMDQAVGQIGAGAVDTYFAVSDLKEASTDLNETSKENKKKQVQVKYDSIAQKAGLLKYDTKLKDPSNEVRRKKIENDLEKEIKQYNKEYKSSSKEKRTIGESQYAKTYPNTIEKDAIAEMAQEGWNKTQERRKNSGYYNRPENKSENKLENKLPTKISTQTNPTENANLPGRILSKAAEEGLLFKPENDLQKQQISAEAVSPSDIRPEIAPSDVQTEVIPATSPVVPPGKDSSSTFDSMDGTLDEISKNTQTTNQKFSQLLGAVENLTNAILKQNTSGITINSVAQNNDSQETFISYANNGNSAPRSFRNYNQLVRPQPQ